MNKIKKNEMTNFLFITAFSIITMTELVLTAKRISLYKKKAENVYLVGLTIFYTLVLGLVFFIDALESKNIFQVKCYPRILFYTTLQIVLDILKEGSEGSVYSFLCLACIFIECIILYKYYSKLEIEYKWYFYKRFGLSEKIQIVQRLKQELLVYYKVDIIINISSILNRIIRDHNILLEFLNITAIVIASICFIGWRNCESYLNRGIIIISYCVKVTSTLYDLISIFPYFNFLSLYAMIRAFYIITNDIFFLIALVNEVQYFGEVNSESLTQNVRKERKKLE